jgi:hypothetical protein
MVEYQLTIVIAQARQLLMKGMRRHFSALRPGWVRQTTSSCICFMYGMTAAPRAIIIWCLVPVLACI